MQYTIIKESINIEVADIPTMSEMSDNDYKEYLETSLLFTDHHGVLRSTQGEYPIACSKSQLETLISYLESIKPNIEQ